jgi:hypothetical protein
MPYTGVVLTFLAIHLAAFLILLGHWVAAVGMFPEATKGFAAQYDHRPLRVILVGIMTFAGVFFALLVLGRIPVAGIRNVVVGLGIFIPLLIAFIGSAGLALRIGRNLSPSGEPWRHVLRGGVMLALVFITPLLGSVFLLPIGLASGLGSFILARPWKAKAPALPAMAPASSAAADAAPSSAVVPSLS